MRIALTAPFFFLLVGVVVAACNDDGTGSSPAGRSVSPTGATPTVDPWEKLRQRPLALPTPGSSCPITETQEVSSAFAAAAGDGPVYPVLGARGQMELGTGLVEGGWEYLKVLWVSDDRYRGPLLIRGGQIDGENDVRFQSGTDPPEQLELPIESWAWTPGQEPGWRTWPSYTRLRGPGCYAYQIDGSDLTLFVVFEAVGAVSP